MSSQLNRLPNGTIEITFVVAWTDIQKAYEHEVQEAVAAAELPGFRKGKAPRAEVEAKLDKNQLYSHALQHLVPTVYSKAVEEHKLKPVLYPNISIKDGKQGQDWTLLATTCEAPEVTLPKLKLPTGTKELKDIIAWLTSNSQLHIPDLIIESEADHRIAALAENLSKLGLTVDKYLETKKITAESLRADTVTTARTDLGVEFILQKVQVDHKLENRQKTLDFLMTLV